MLRKESEVVLKGKGPVLQQEEFGSGQPMLENVYQMMISLQKLGHENGRASSRV